MDEDIREEKDRLHPKVDYLYLHFFRFFDIRNFLPDDLKKRFFFYWNKYFHKRDYLEKSFREKDDALENLNVDDILSEINEISEDIKNFNDKLSDLLKEIDTDELNTENAAKSFEDMLAGIII